MFTEFLLDPVSFLQITKIFMLLKLQVQTATEQLETRHEGRSLYLAMLRLKHDTNNEVSCDLDTFHKTYFLQRITATYRLCP